MRRNVHRAGIVGESRDAVDKYIAERNHKRVKGIDIQKHRRFAPTDAGTLTFAGIRHVEGHTLALLRQENEVLVQPVDDATAGRLKRVSIDSPVTMTPDGAIRRKGRSR